MDKLDLLPASPTNLLHIFQQTLPNDTVHSKIISKLCIYYSHEKLERLLKQKEIREKHYFFPHLFFAPCLFTLRVWQYFVYRSRDEWTCHSSATECLLELSARVFT